MNDENVSKGSTNNSNEASSVPPFKVNISNELSSSLKGTATPPAPKQLLARSFLNSLKAPNQNPTGVRATVGGAFTVMGMLDRLRHRLNNNQPGGIYNLKVTYFMNYKVEIVDTNQYTI